jgi:hypothetical protein
VADAVSKNVHVPPVVQTQHVDVELHLFDFHCQLVLDGCSVLMLLAVLMPTRCIAIAIMAVPGEGILSAHQEVDGALVVLRR